MTRDEYEGRKRRIEEQHLMGVLPSLPELFDRDDVCRALGYEPKRSVLFRVYERLVEQGVVQKVTRGGGRAPSQYRKVEAGVAPDVE